MEPNEWPIGQVVFSDVLPGDDFFQGSRLVARCEDEYLFTGADQKPFLLSLDDVLQYALRPAVYFAGVVLRHPDGRILGLRKLNGVALPRGKVEPTETPAAAAERVCREETGVAVVCRGPIYVGSPMFGSWTFIYAANPAGTS